MYDPKTVLTPSGYRQLCTHVGNMEMALDFITNHASDLHIGALDPDQLDALYKLRSMIESGDACLLLNGDGEKDEDDG